MRALTPCIVILSLALASSALATEENKIHEKNYDFGDEKEVLLTIDQVPDEFVYVLCEGSEADKKCKVYLESLDPNVNFSYSCDVNLKYKYPYVETLNVKNTGYNKVVFITTEGQNTKFIIMNMSGCQIKEATIEVKNISKYFNSPEVFFVPHENNYGIIYGNSKLCQDFLCKATLDYDGNVVKAASTFIKNDGFINKASLEIKSIGKNYLYRLYNYAEHKVSLIRNDDLYETPLLVLERKAGVIATSTEENKIGICYSNRYNTLTCKQYDAEGKTKIFEAEAKFSYDYTLAQMFHVLNFEKGLFVAITLVNIRDRTIVRQGLVYFDEQGKQGKFNTFDIESFRFGDFVFFKNAIGEPCIAGIEATAPPPSHHFYSNKFTITTKCFTKNELGQI